MFPLDGFAVHSVRFTFLVNWFEEDSGRTGDRRNGSAWNLRFRTEGAIPLAAVRHGPSRRLTRGAAPASYLLTCQPNAE
jgi:hypothetical protein